MIFFFMFVISMGLWFEMIFIFSFDAEFITNITKYSLFVILRTVYNFIFISIHLFE